MGALALPGDPRAVSLTGSLAVVACGTAGVAVVDVSQPQAPVLMGATATRPDGSSVASSVTARGHLAYVVDGAMGIYGGLKVIELLDPTNPVVVGGSPGNLTFGLTRVALENGFALASEFFIISQLEIFDVGALPISYVAPLNPATQFAPAPPRASDIAVRQGAFFESANAELIDFGSAGDGGGLYTGIYQLPVDYGSSPPTVSITSPAAGASAPARLPLTVTATASDEVAVNSVAFLVNGAVVDTVYQAPFQTTFLVPSGAPRLVLGAIATAVSGLQATAPEVVVNGAPNSLPAVSLLSPVDGQIVRVGETLALAAQASDPLEVPKVAFSVNGVPVGTAVAPPYRVSYVVPSGAATLAVTANVFDSAGQGNAAGPVVAVVAPDQPPVVGIISPADGASYVQGATIDVLVGASDDTAVASVHLLVDGTEVGSVLQLPYRFTIPGPAAGQSKRLQAVAYDTAGLLAFSPEIAVTGIGDLGTTVSGRVVTRLGTAAAAAQLSCAGVSGVADAQGAFRFGPVPTAQARISCAATYHDAQGLLYTGVAAAVPVPGGVTDLGTITVLRGFLYPGPKLAMGPAALPVGVAVADLNGDGVPDLVIADTGTGITVLLGNADGSYQDPVIYGLGGGAESLAIGDFNGDGILDVAAVDGASVVSILLGNGDGTLQPGQIMPLQGAGSQIVTADLNGDGTPDLAVPSRASTDPAPSPGAVWDALGRGNGTFDFVRIASGSVQGLAAADLNGDGKLDLVAAPGIFGGGLAVYFGNGDGTFQAPQLLSDGHGPVAVAARDLNGDGLPDVVAAEGGSFQGGVAVFLNQGSGNFAPPIYLPGDAAPADAVTVGDLNGDGIPDIVAAHQDDDQLSLYLGLGDGSFRPERILYTGAGPSAIAIADLNRDGIPDLVTANSFSLDLSLLYGGGNGAFPQQLRFAAGAGGQAVTLGDFNRDGTPDLAVASSSTGEVAVLLGNGDGSFAAERRFAAGNLPFAIAAGDFNGDGVPDLITANNQSNDVSVLLGVGDGTFGGSRATAVGSFPCRGGDGRPQRRRQARRGYRQQRR